MLQGTQPIVYVLNLLFQLAPGGGLAGDFCVEVLILFLVFQKQLLAFRDGFLLGGRQGDVFFCELLLILQKLVHGFAGAVGAVAKDFLVFLKITDGAGNLVFLIGEVILFLFQLAKGRGLLNVFYVGNGDGADVIKDEGPKPEEEKREEAGSNI